MALPTLRTGATADSHSQLPRKGGKSHFVSGGLSGLASAVILQPADLLKTRLQQAPPTGSATATLVNTIHSIASGPSPIRSLWRGTLPSAIRTGAGSAMYFSTLNLARGVVAGTSSPSSSRTSTSSSLPQLSALANLFTGAATRAGVGYIMMPVTILKVRYESSLYSYTSLSAAAKDIFRAEGARGFFSGWGATAARDAPYAGLYVLFYEQGKSSLSKIYPQKGGMDANTATVINVVSGAVAAAAATAATNPFDALKTRIQVTPERYRNMWYAAKMVWAEDSGSRWRGRALFDGLGLRVGRKAVSSALAWGLYERLVR